MTKTAVKTLGIYIGHDKAECYNKNWIKTYHEMEKFLNHGKDENCRFLENVRL